MNDAAQKAFDAFMAKRDTSFWRDAIFGTHPHEFWFAAWEAANAAHATSSAVGAEGLTDKQREVLLFLWGSGMLQGVGFGTRPENEKGNFWWRKPLIAAFPQLRMSATPLPSEPLAAAASPDVAKMVEAMVTNVWLAASELGDMRIMAARDRANSDDVAEAQQAFEIELAALGAAATQARAAESAPPEAAGVQS